MIRNVLLILLLLPFSVFAQVKDTFNTERELKEITIKAGTKRNTNISVINAIRNNITVSDGLSSESISKTPDRNVGDALKRVNGVTIQNDRFVLVRGLADRYNLTILNKTVLPSTEPDRRSFSFDIIPTSLVDNIIIIKSAAANLPGDFGGGIVQITTKEVSKSFSNIGIGTGLGSITTFRGFQSVKPVSFPNTFPSTKNYRISSLNERIGYTSTINSPETNKFIALPNLNANFSSGIKRGDWSGIFTLNGRNTFSVTRFQRLDYQTPTELAFKYNDTNFTKSFLTNGLLNVSYSGKWKLNFKTIFSHQIERNQLQRSGDNWDNLQTINATASNSIIKTMFNTQIDGKVWGINFNAGYNFIYRYQPDYRITPLTKSLGSNDNLNIAWRDTYRFWSILNENGISGNLNKDIKNFKIGGGFTNRYRQFSARVFRYTSTELLDEITNNTDTYNADFKLGNAYVLWDKKIGRVFINTGLRSEYNLFNVNTSDFSGQSVVVQRTYLDLLPSFNLSYNLEKTKFRLSASKTLARPEFREVANFAYYDFVRNAQILGNPQLEKTDIFNADAKFEWYPKAGETFSLSFFGKRFINPIEQIVDNGSVPSNLILTFSNPKNAVVYGLEFELRKGITKWLDLYANGCLINSKVKANGVVRQLQGQSNYIVNGGINLHKEKNTLNITYNRIGERISWVGFQGYGDIFENARDVIDIVWLRTIKVGELKVSISDIFAQPTKFYQKDKSQNLIQQQNETAISLTLNINL